MWRNYIFNVHGLKPRRKLLREKSTQTEKMLWEWLRNNQLGYKFFRQYSIEGYVIDFYCPELRLGIEIEGSIHSLEDVKKYDSYRKKYLSSFNIKFIKISNIEITTNIRSVVERIKSALNTPS